jgi:predicted DsbA family dithiol-disulfide isomerase
MDLKKAVSKRDHVRGGAAASVTLVEYGDFDCPFCAEAYPVVKALLARFGQDLRFVFRHNPRGELHPNAHVAAEAAEAAALQLKFWEMHDALFEHSKQLELPLLGRYAKELGLDVARFEAELRAPAVKSRVKEDEVGGLESGVIGTPTFFIDGKHFRDKPDLDTLGRAIEAALARRAAQQHAAPAHEIHRRDGSGHLDPAYEAALRAETGHARGRDDARAFLGGARSTESLSEQLGEEFVETVTGAQDEGAEVFDQVVPEETGGPFVETSGSTEFAPGTDASNIKGATREPFPKT